MDVRNYSRRQLLTTTLGGLLGVELAACNSTTARVAPTNTATPSATATPAATATPTVRPTSLVISGDIMLSRSVGQRMVAAGTTGLFPFEQTATFLQSFDFRIGNLECVTSLLGAPVPKPFTFRADPLGIQRLQQVGFDVVSVANNHSGDYGPDAFADMLMRLDTAKIAYTGGGLTATQAHTPRIITKNGTRFAFVAACDIDPYSFAATDTQAGHAWLDANGLQKDIPLARSQADFVIVFLHWGLEYVLNYSALQQELAHQAIDLGADIVVGAHPHVIQPNEIYKGKPIIYSLGNFVFDLMYDVTSHGNLLTMNVKGNELLDWKLVPITIDTNTGAPMLA